MLIPDPTGWIRSAGEVLRARHPSPGDDREQRRLRPLHQAPRLHRRRDHRAAETDGPCLTAPTRPGARTASPVGPSWKIPVEYHVKVWGLGYSQVDVRSPAVDRHSRSGSCRFRSTTNTSTCVLGMAAHSQTGVPRGRCSGAIAHNILCKEVEQDLDVWDHKVFREAAAPREGRRPDRRLPPLGAAVLPADQRQRLTARRSRIAIRSWIASTR